jgi:hypothetical protein
MIRIPFGEEQVDLLLADVSIERVQVLLERRLEVAIVLRHRHLGQADDIFCASLELSPYLDLVAQASGFLGEPLGSLRILPDVGVG